MVVSGSLTLCKARMEQHLGPMLSLVHIVVAMIKSSSRLYAQLNRFVDHRFGA